MAKSGAWRSSLLLLVFNNLDVANIGDAGGLQGSAVAGSLWVSLHTADPGIGGNQSTNEANYTGYARIAVARTAGEWTVVGNTVQNVNVLLFPACTGGSSLITHFAVGVASAGATTMLYSGTVTPQINITNGVTPRVPALGGTITEE